MNSHTPDGHQPTSPRALERPVSHTSAAPPVSPIPRPFEAQRLQRGLQSRALRLLRGKRFAQRSALSALVLEQKLLGVRRHPDTRSYIEILIASLGKAAGDTVIEEVYQDLDKLAETTDDLRAQQAILRDRAAGIRDEHIDHPDGGVRTVAETLADEREQRELIQADQRAGSRRHRHLSVLLRRAPAGFFVFDALLLLWFFSGVTNVDWTNHPASVSLVVAIGMAAIATGATFVLCRHVGDRLLHYKDDEGHLSLLGMDWWTRTSAALAVATVTVMAPFMFIRMRSEVLDDLGQKVQGTAIIVGLVLALVTVLAVYVTIAVHALDGSLETERLNDLGKAVAGPLEMETELHQQIKDLDGQIAANLRKAQRMVTEAKTRAGHKRAQADRLIDAARGIHQGVGPLSERAVDPNYSDGVIGYRHTEATPEVDERPLGTAIRHISTPLPPSDGTTA